MSTEIKVPDLGGVEDVEVIEIAVAVGDTIEPEQTLITLESDKASIEVPAPEAGEVASLNIAVGDKVSEGDLILTLLAAAGASATAAQENSVAAEAATPSEAAAEKPIANETPQNAAPEPTQSSVDIEIKVPDLGGSSDVEVIEIAVAAGDTIEAEATLITLESDKASIEVPAPQAGVVSALRLKVGDRVSEGDAILMLTTVATPATTDAPVEAKPAQVPASANEGNPSTPEPEKTFQAPSEVVTQPTAPSSTVSSTNLSASVHAGPAVRRLANQLGVELQRVTGSGPKGRILKEDLKAFVKQQLTQPRAAASSGGIATEPLPEIDFSKWGETEPVALTKIQRVSATNLHRSWVTIPHVTQFDEADITEMNRFRKSESERLKATGVKLTPLAFIIKAVAYTLKQFPKFNASLSSDGGSIIYKKYCHIGFAVDTPNGLVVPVLRDADQRSLVEIAEDLQRLSAKARDKKLTPQEMQGGCFTISSLGGIGGTHFTPIVNWPEVAILGVSRTKESPVWQAGEWQPRLMLPLSLSYDHRVIDGADAARFTSYLSQVLGDIRRMLL